MTRINREKTQRGRQQPSISLCINPEAKYSLSVCICLPTSDTSNMEKIEKLMSYFSKSFVVFIGEGAPIDHGIFIPSADVPEATCRNIYLSFVIAYRSMFDVMLVIDPELSLHKEIPSSSFSCCSPERLPTWDAVFANQSYKYYDMQHLITDDESYKLKKHIPRYTSPIPVQSAFGGMALYKTQYLSANMYNSEGHTVFNRRYIRNGGVRMFLDPSLVLETPPQNLHLYL
jgi:hypothetical protein